MDHEDDGFREYFAARLPSLLRLAYLLTGDVGEAEDLTQTALARTYVSWRRVQSSDRPDAYVRRIMINANARRFRRRQPAQVLVAEPPDRGRRSAELAAVEDRAGLAQALASLPPRQRAVVVLRYCEDASEIEVARMMRCSVGTVKSQASKGLAKLRVHPSLADSSLATVAAPVSPPQATRTTPMTRTTSDRMTDDQVAGDRGGRR